MEQPKKLKSEFGEFDFDTPRDRNNEFEPKIMSKNKRNVSGIEDKIISLYGRGLSTRKINAQIQDLYGIEVSSTMVSNITNQILPRIKEWQDRPLDSIYPIFFIDAVHFSVRKETSVVKKAAYIVLGVKDILIMCSDGLTGIKEAITTAFPKTVQQMCIGHMIRNSVRFVSYKELKAFCNDLKSIYTAKNEKDRYDQLQKMKEKWQSKYPTALRNWEDN